MTYSARTINNTPKQVAMQSKELSIILPAYKPCTGWHLYALERLAELQALRPEWCMRLIITTDGSSEGHNPEVEEVLHQHFGDKLLYIRDKVNRGKGACLRTAVAQATTEYILYTDWDFPFTTDTYLQALDLLAMGAEVVLPVRQTEVYRRQLPWGRRLLSAGSNMMNRLCFSLPSHDTQGGVKAFNHRGREVFLQTKIDRFLFDTEFIALATRLGLDIRLSACNIREGIVMSPMSWRTLRTELKNIKRLFVARWFS